MANRLTMAKIQAILSLHEQGWPNRQIARELDVGRASVAKYVRAAGYDPKPAKAPIGSGETDERAAESREGPASAEASGEKGEIGTSPSSPLSDVPPDNSKPAKAPIGSGPKPATGSESKPAEAPIGSARILDVADPVQSPPDQVAEIEASAPAVSSEKEGGRSACEPYRQIILEKLELGLSAQRIYQDLRAEGFDHEYHSVRRFVAKLRGTSPLPFRRMECEAGEEAQVDFGTGAWIELPDGKRRKSHVFRTVLSFSRKGYCEAVYRQTTEDFIRCIENAFWHFGGVPKILVIDNLKAAVKQPDWYDPDLNPKIQSFCEHYGVVILPTKPRTPRHKGKIESGVGYVQNNGLKGHRFTSLEAENEHLVRWETTIADTRLHGTIRKQVGKLFQEVERGALKRLPIERFPFFHEGKRIVHRDGHVEVAKAYYSVLPEHIPHQKRSGVERGAVWLLGRARLVGEHTARWAENMLQTRGIEGVRVLQGLLVLAKRHDTQAIERACQVAFSHGVWRLKTIRQLLQRDAPEQETFDFLQEHPIIRSLSDYGKLVATSFERPWGRDQRPQFPPPNPHPLPSSLCSVSSTQNRSDCHE
ncbi:MAG: IS21 family transposase [Planctomycetota bacterium]